MLTPKQHEEVQLAILQYLKTNGFIESFKTLSKEINVEEGIEAGSALERKWTSIIRLQKKISVLEASVKLLDHSNSEFLLGNDSAALAETSDVAIRSKFRGKTISTDNLRDAKVVVQLKGHQKAVNCVAFHPYQNILASASDDSTIKLFDLESGNCEKTLKGHTMPVTSVKFTSDGNLLVSASADLTIKMWDASKEYICIRTLQGHEHTISSVLILESLGQIVSVSRDCSVRVWDIGNGYCLNALFGHNDWVREVEASKDESMVASCGNDKLVVVWDPVNWTVKAELHGHDHVVEAVSFLPTSKTSMNFTTLQLLASASRDKSIKLWNLDNLECVFTLIGHDDWVRDVFFCPDGSSLLSVGDDKSIRLWDSATGKEEIILYQCHSLPINKIILHHSMPILATASADKTVKLWKF